MAKALNDSISTAMLASYEGVRPRRPRARLQAFNRACPASAMPPKHKHAATPKRKSVAIKPKAKPKAAAPRKRCDASHPSALEAPEEEQAESMLGGGNAARANRENKRRDTDEQVESIITTRVLPYS